MSSHTVYYTAADQDLSSNFFVGLAIWADTWPSISKLSERKELKSVKRKTDFSGYAQSMLQISPPKIRSLWFQLDYYVLQSCSAPTNIKQVTKNVNFMVFCVLDILFVEERHHL